MSTGLHTLATGGKNALSACWVSSCKLARCRPCASRASAAVTPGPPELVNTATDRPWGRGHHARARAQSNISSVVSARITPARSKAALKALSWPASAPVCDAAARRPLAKRPTLSAMTGFCLVTRRACSTKRRPSLTPSRYRLSTRVCGSAATGASTSVSLTSTWLPRLTSREMPIPCPRAQSTNAAQMAPEWEIKATSPGGGGGGLRKVVSSGR